MLDYYLVSNLHLGDQGRQFTLGLSLIRICFPFYETFSLIPYVFNQKFYANRLNVLMCPWPCWSDLQTSNLLQTSSLNISSARQQRVWISTRRLLPSRWASWGWYAPTLKRHTVLVNECKFSSSFKSFKASNCAHTHSRNPGVAVTYVWLNQCKDLFQLPRTCVISKTPHESWMNRRCRLHTTVQHGRPKSSTSASP